MYAIYLQISFLALTTVSKILPYPQLWKEHMMIALVSNYSDSVLSLELRHQVVAVGIL